MTSPSSTTEQVRIFKETWWADLIAEAEWKALLKEEGFTPSAKSRLKRKAVGWLIALGRIAALDPDFYNEVHRTAREMYAAQLGEPHPAMREPEKAVTA